MPLLVFHGSVPSFTTPAASFPQESLAQSPTQAANTLLPGPDNPSTITSLLLTTLRLNLNLDPFNDTISASDLGLTGSLEAALDGLSTLLRAVAVLFSVGIGFTGLAFLSAVPALTLSSDSTAGLNSDQAARAYAWGVWTNLVFTSAALFFLILGGLAAAAGAKVAEDKVAGLGSDLGVSAVAGTNWIALAWAGVALMAVVLAYWAWRAARLRRTARAAEEEVEMGEQEEEQRKPMPMPMPIRRPLPDFSRAPPRRGRSPMGERR